GLLARLGLLDGEVTTNEVIAHAFELCGLPADERFNVGRFANVAESDLQRDLHQFTSNPWNERDNRSLEFIEAARVPLFNTFPKNSSRNFAFASRSRN